MTVKTSKLLEVIAKTMAEFGDIDVAINYPVYGNTVKIENEEDLKVCVQVPMTGNGKPTLILAPENVPITWLHIDGIDNEEA